MKRYWPVLLALAVAAVIGVALLEPTYRVRGFLSGENFYRGRPVAYWREALVHSDPARQSEAVHALREGKSESLPVLIDLLGSQQDSEWTTVEARWRAAQIIGEMGADAKAAIPALMEAVHDQDPHVRSVVLGVLSNLEPPPEEALPIFLNALKTDDRFAAARGVSRLGAWAAEAVPTLEGLLADSNPEMRRIAAKALGNIGPESRSAVPALIAALRDEDDRVREHSAESLGEIGEDAKEAVPALVLLLKDRVARVRRDAVRSLGQIGPAALPHLPAIRELRKDEDARVREAADKAVYRLLPPGSEDAKRP